MHCQRWEHLKPQDNKTASSQDSPCICKLLLGCRPTRQLRSLRGSSLPVSDHTSFSSAAEPFTSSTM